MNAFQQIHARTRPKRGLTGACTALAGPSATCHHPLASPALIGAASEPPRRPNGRNLAAGTATPNGHIYECVAE
jgi:hypothetical protein